MIYAVSIETTQLLPMGRARRVSRVLVDAKDGEEAGRLAERRFRFRPAIKRCVVRSVVAMSQAALAPARIETGERETAPPPRRAQRRKRGRKSNKRKSA